jgi:dolichol-phosphate mannosyltransferase
MDLSVVIPTLDERENIRLLIERLVPTLDEAGIEAEIIVVDDDSPDRTWEVAAELADRHGNVLVIRRPGRWGIASAWVEGCQAARGLFIALMDGDLAHSPEDLVRLYGACTGGGHDMVIGSRYLPDAGGMREKSRLAVAASKVAQRLTRAALGVEGTDITHSFRVFRREVWGAIGGEIAGGGNVFLAEFVYRARAEGFGVAELPITYGRRLYGRTKLSLARETLRYLHRLWQLRRSQ